MVRELVASPTSIVRSAFWLIVAGLVFAVVVTSFLPTPAPPACTTLTCNASYTASLLGLLLLFAGVGLLAYAIYRLGGPTASPEPPNVPQYGFGTPTPSPPPPLAPSPSPTGPPVPGGTAFVNCPKCSARYPSGAYIYCPACGTRITS